MFFFSVLINPPQTPSFLSYVSLYNSAMKLIFLGCSFAILYQMQAARGVRSTYDASHDTFRTPFLLAPCAALAFFTTADRSPMELAWTFSIWLEAVAILPQLVLLQRTGNVDNLTGHYVALLGSYRALYLLNWVWRAATEAWYRAPTAWCAGALQTGLYVDFFYYYARAWRNNEKLHLPS